MSTYATAEQLAQCATDGWDELAEFTSRSRDVTGDLLAARYAGTDTDDSAEAKSAADDSLAKIDQLLTEVSRYADTYLNQRYRELIPLSAEHYDNTGLPWAVAMIALGRLYGIRQTDEMRKGLRAQEDYLRDLAAGRASLDYTQPTTPESAGNMTVKSRPSAFDMTGY